MEKTIICIGREYGSGGHAIGKILAKRTGYEFYDKDRFIAIAKERGFEGEVEEYLEEQPMNSLLYSIALNYSRPKKKPFPFELVEELAAEKPCIIIGRCRSLLCRNVSHIHLSLLAYYILYQEQYQDKFTHLIKFFDETSKLWMYYPNSWSNLTPILIPSTTPALS